MDFFLASPPLLGTVTLTVDGSLSYIPCPACNGFDSFEIYIIERPFGINNAPLSSTGRIVVEIRNVNRNPSLFVYGEDFPESLGVSAQQVVQVYVGGNRTDPVSVVQIAGLDLDGYADDLSVATQNGEFGTAGFEIWLDAVNVIESLPLTSPNVPTFRGYAAFIGVNVTYQPNEIDFTGSDVIQIFVRDSFSTLSEQLTVNVTVLPSWCVNGGVCAGSSTDPDCSDIESRRNTPESYSCSCPSGYGGQYCGVDERRVEPLVERGKGGEGGREGKGREGKDGGREGVSEEGREM